MHFEAYLH